MCTACVSYGLKYQMEVKVSQQDSTDSKTSETRIVFDAYCCQSIFSDLSIYGCRIYWQQLQKECIQKGKKAPTGKTS